MACRNCLRAFNMKKNYRLKKCNLKLSTSNSKTNYSTQKVPKAERLNKNTFLQENTKCYA